MVNHFRAFSFVDRITSVQAGGRIAGDYAVPPVLESFPGSLVAEAVGQLAAWAAMAAHNFERRPIAGLAGSIELLAPVQPGQVLALTAELESADEDAVAYGGTARVEGIPVIRLQDCVGPMVPADEFDNPQALRDRFAFLCGFGASPGGFSGLPALTAERNGGEIGRRATAVFQVPASAPFFADHFPRRPVFPGSLIMHVNLQLASALAEELSPPGPTARWVLRAVLDMKLRAFIAPGESLNLEVRVSDCLAGSATLAMETRNGREIVATARLLFMPEERP